MRLKTLDYVQFRDTPRQWELSDMTLGAVNLVVGKNAAGKTRTLNVIHGLGKLVSGRQKPSDLTTGTYSATFELDGQEVSYFLDIRDRKVVAEQFEQGGRVLLRRGQGGVGSIWHERQRQDFDFQTPETDAAVVARMDAIQHGFLAPLGEWGEGVRHYEFGGKMGHNHLTLFIKEGPLPDPRDVNAVVALFRKGATQNGERFLQSVISDMNAIGYRIDEIGVMAPTDLQVQAANGLTVDPLILYVKERDLPAVTQQIEMSQGMFRALSVLIHLNYGIATSRPSCIIVDDIGEGLDFDRSSRLIELLRNKARESDVQLILSTNDRLVMNKVPLEEWSLLQREGGHVRVRNYENSKAVFDEFKFTGLSNFDFLATDFINEPVEEVVGE